MSFTDTIPPREDQILPAVKTLLSVSSIDDLLQGSDRVAVQYADELAKLNQNAEGRIILMERTGADGAREYLDRVRTFEFNVRVDLLKLPNSTFDPTRLLNKIHAVVYDLLQGKSPSITLARYVVPITRRHAPGRTWEKDNVFSKSAHFMTVIQAA